MVKILFWLFVAVDLVVLVIFGLLGLAAARPSHTNPFAAILIPFVLPGAILCGAVWLFLHSHTTAGRLLALGVAALPFLVVVISQGASLLTLSAHRDAEGNIRQFRSGPLREIEVAIERHDAVAVAAAARGAKLDTPSISGATVLVFALRQLDETPDQLDVVRALLQAGADPNAGGDELPLQVAIGASRKSGPEPVRLLLEAGANPNALTSFGDPAYFTGGGAEIDVEIMQLLLDRGADVRLLDKDGQGAVFLPSITENWKVLLLVLQKGAPWRDQKSVGGVPLRTYLENEAHHDPDPGLADVLAFFRAADGVPGQ